MHEGPVPLDSLLHGSEADCGVVGAVDVVFDAFIGVFDVGVLGHV